VLKLASCAVTAIRSIPAVILNFTFLPRLRRLPNTIGPDSVKWRPGVRTVDATMTFEEENSRAGLFGVTGVSELKQKSVRGGVVLIAAQGLALVLQTGSTMILARLLSPADFGLQGMVVAVVGFLALFRDAGLSVVTVQRNTLTHEETSTLFWINLAVGVTLTILVSAMAPALVAFYNEPRLFWVTIASSLTFVLNSVAVQHRALLQRTMQFKTMAKIDLLALAVGATAGIAMAAVGCGYWALVAMALSAPLVTAAATWFAMPWLPTKPRPNCDVRSMLRFGGVVTLNSLVVYLAYNTEKILLGRIWGAEALGLYGRAYQLITLPVQQLNSSINSVAFPALSRIQNDIERLRRSFLKGYSALVAVTIPVMIVCALFAEEIVRIVLGPQWSDAAVVLRFLAPAALSFTLVNPFGWLLQALGQVVRSLHIALLIAPVIILAIVAGLPYGPKGVAFAYSIAMTLLIVPIVAWAAYGTGITMKDYWNAIKQSVLSGVLAGGACLIFKIVLTEVLTPLFTLLVGFTLFLSIYSWLLLFPTRQQDLYKELLSPLLNRDGSIRPRRT
jgi:O-antigen/teichoic acid export membrane protein